MTDNSKTAPEYRLVPVVPRTFIVGFKPMDSTIERAATHAEALRIQRAMQDEAELRARAAFARGSAASFDPQKVAKVRIFQAPHEGFFEVLPAEPVTE